MKIISKVAALALIAFTTCFNGLMAAGGDIIVTSVPLPPKPADEGKYCDFVSDEKGETIYCIEKTLRPDKKGYAFVSINTWRLKNNAWEKFGSEHKKVWITSNMCSIGNRIFLLSNISIRLTTGRKAGEDQTRILELKGDKWDTIGKFSGQAKGLVLYKEKLYAYGIFDLGLPNDDHIVLMENNGNSWNPIKAKPTSNPHNPSSISQAVVYKNWLVVCGTVNIKTADGSANGVALWDGEKWTSPGFSSYFGMSQLCVYNDKLYIGGEFTSVNKKQEEINHILCWDNVNGVDGMLGGIKGNSGEGGRVYGLQVINDKLSIAGSYAKVGGKKWDYAGPLGWNGREYSPVFSSIKYDTKKSIEFMFSGWCPIGNKWLIPETIIELNGQKIEGFSLIEFKN